MLGDGQTWELARPLLLTLGSLVGLTVLTWWLTRERAAILWLRVPIFFVSAAVCTWAFFQNDPDPASRSYAMAAALAALLSGTVHLAVQFFFQAFISRQREIRFPPLLRNVLLGISYVAILLLCLKVFNRDFSLTPILVTSGVLSLIVGLALQDILGNFLAGVVLTVEKPFLIDDWIEVGDLRGKVVSVTWRTTKLLTRDNDYVIVPNKKVADSQLENRSTPTPLHQERLAIGLPYETLPSQAERALLEAASRVDGVCANPAPRVFLVGFEDSSIAYELGFWTENPDQLFLITSNVRKEIYYSIRRYGISIPFPVRDVRQRTAEAPVQTWKEATRFRLEVVDGPFRGLVFPVRDQSVIGRSSDCDVELRDPAISKHHARLRQVEEGLAIEDLDSAHGTLLNGLPPTGQLLRTGDEVEIGGSVLRFEEIVAT